MAEVLTELIKRGREIGRFKSPSRSYIFHVCPICDKQRWVALIMGNAESDRCNQCKWDGRKGENHPRWVKNNYQSFQGYIQTRLHKDDFFYSMTDRKGWVFEHRLVIAKSLGRCLHLWEIVHHINHIKNDNRLENLQLISDDRHKQLTILEVKIDRLITRQDELMAEIKLLRWENKQLKEGITQ